MKWVSTLSLESDLSRASQACCDDVGKALAGQDPDLLVLFVSPHHRAELDDLAARLLTQTGARHLVGCTGGGIVGAGREVEREAALSLTAAILPGVELVPFHLEHADLPSETEAERLYRLVDAGPEPAFLLFSEPFSINAERLIRTLDLAYPQSPKIGGVVSGGMGPGRHDLFLDDRIFHTGAVGLALSGDFQLDTIVAQGCRPIGQPMFITRCRDNLLQELSGQSPHSVLRGIYETLDQADRFLFQRSLFLGIEMTMKEEAYGQGDFLVRNIMSLDPETGFLEVGTQLQETAVAQFHLRDAATSREDLDRHLSRYLAECGTNRPAGALMFSCLGRGRDLYGTPNHDADLFAEKLGPAPLGGFFCNGEIGPVQGRTYLHAYTSSFALFQPRG